MIKAISQGIVSGLLISFMFGPVFFGLIHASIHRGFRKALVYASGVASSDSFFILLIYFGVAGFLQDESFRLFMKIVGCGIMITFGIYYIIKKAPDTLEVENESERKQKPYHSLWLKGFVLNSINPSVFVICLGMVSYAADNYANDKISTFAFFIGSVLTVFSFDTIKAYIAHKIKIYFTNRLLNKMNKVLGIVILGAGLILFYDLIRN
ncbi:MAG TPA: LysE family transporter [Cytophagaceae bacterium]|jgi:threonine/homoserine/homoserine lactone efflux protein|nr:LysE family transporter [Cytophagaceae bacterium]